MRSTLHLVFVIHQPVGTPDPVMRAAATASYEPLIALFERFADDIRPALHCSGYLLEWLARHNEALVDRIEALVRDGVVEMIGGGFYAPLIPIVPWRDGIGQLEMTAGYLERLMGVRPAGVWLTDLVWEPRMAELLADGGATYSFVDEAIVKDAGRTAPLDGMYLTEHVGRPLLVFAVNARLSEQVQSGRWRKALKNIGRRATAYAERPEITLTLRSESLVLQPDGEHALRAMCEHIVARRGRFRVRHPGRTAAKKRPRGTIYLRPTTSLGRPLAQQHFVRYAEASWMHKRMIEVSRRFAALERVMRNDGFKGLSKLVKPRRALFRGQAATIYEQGGTVYRPAVRDGVYRNLIACENQAHALIRGQEPFLETSIRDLFATLETAVLLRNPVLRAVLLLQPGGTLAAFEHSPSCTALHNVFTRRAEPWHPPGTPLDMHTRSSLHDRFLGPDCNIDAWLDDSGERGDLLHSRYRLIGLDSSGRGADEKTVVTLAADGSVMFDGVTVGVSMVKRVSLHARADRLTVGYDVLFDQPLPSALTFGCELNWAHLPWLGDAAITTTSSPDHEPRPRADAKEPSNEPGNEPSPVSSEEREQPAGEDIERRVAHRDCLRLAMHHQGLRIAVFVDSEERFDAMRAPIRTLDPSRGPLQERTQGVAILLCRALAAGSTSLSWRFTLGASALK